MKRLTQEQELKIIQALYDEDDYVGHGGGRMVFNMPEYIADELGLDGEYIVKVAIGEKGLSQNILEIDTYDCYNERLALAEIPYYGRVIEIMEKVDTDITDTLYRVADEYEIDFDEDADTDSFYDDLYDSFYDALDEYYTDGEIDLGAGATQLTELMIQLIHLNGSTADNGQIGLNGEGRFVAYDYGYTTNSYTSEQCSDTRDYIGADLHRHTLLNLILENAYFDCDLFEEDNVGFMAAVEREFFDHLHDDDDICCYDDEEDEEDDCSANTKVSYREFFEHMEQIENYNNIQASIACNKDAFFSTEEMLNDLNFEIPLEIQYEAHDYYVPENVNVFWKNFLTDWQKFSNIYYSL